jgi:hypothetical protein
MYAYYQTRLRAMQNSEIKVYWWEAKLVEVLNDACNVLLFLGNEETDLEA